MMIILCVVGFVLAAAVCIVLLGLAITDIDMGDFFFAVVFGIIAYVAWIGIGHFDAIDNATWRKGDTVVYTVTTTSDGAILIASNGRLFHCLVAAECISLTKGDHTNFQWRGAGDVTLPGLRDPLIDIRNVKKG